MEECFPLLAQPEGTKNPLYCSYVGRHTHTTLPRGNPQCCMANQLQEHMLVEFYIIDLSREWRIEGSKADQKLSAAFDPAEDIENADLMPQSPPQLRLKR